RFAHIICTKSLRIAWLPASEGWIHEMGQVQTRLGQDRRREIHQGHHPGPRRTSPAKEKTIPRVPGAVRPHTGVTTGRDSMGVQTPGNRYRYVWSSPGHG